jgi:hypothetical protein
VLALALALALAATWNGVTAVGGMRTEGYAIPLQGASAARVELEMESGELRLGPGAARLLDGTFTFNVDDWEPEMGYQVVSREGVLHVEQGDPSGPFSMVAGDAVNSWDIDLTPDVPLDLHLDLGSADGTLDLSSLQLLDLQIEGDGGNASLDFGATLGHDLDVELNTDGGDATVAVPSDVGVRVVVVSRGSVSADGFGTTGGAYVNELYGTTPVTLTVTIDAGGGDVRLTQHPAPTPVPSPVLQPAAF